MSLHNYQNIFKVYDLSHYVCLLTDSFNIFSKYDNFNSIILNNTYKHNYEIYNFNDKYVPIFIINFVEYILNLIKLLERNENNELIFNIEINNLKKDYIIYNELKNKLIFKLCFEENYNLDFFHKLKFIGFINKNYLNERINF